MVEKKTKQTTDLRTSRRRAKSTYAFVAYAAAANPLPGSGGRSLGTGGAEGSYRVIFQRSLFNAGPILAATLAWPRQRKRERDIYIYICMQIIYVYTYIHIYM